MGYLDSFELVKPGKSIKRPASRVKRITISSGQITFSKELVISLGSPKQVKIYYNRDVNQIAVTPSRRGGMEFCSKKNVKKICKDKGLLKLFQSFLKPLKTGIYDCIEAEIIEEGGKKIAIFDMEAAVRYETDEETLKNLSNSRRKKTREVDEE